jgi:hypothetical protein
MAKIKFGDFLGVTIPAGTTQSPVAAIPADVNSVRVEISRDNWPSAGADLELRFSYDGGTSFVTKVGPQHIDPFVATPKQTTPTPASIGWGWGWNPDFFGQPTHVRGRISNVAASFVADISLSTG